MAVLEGVDASWGRPGGAALRAAGKRFNVRYLAPGDKGLHQPELDDLTTHGIRVPLVFEGEAGAMDHGRSQGVSDARAAQSLLEQLTGISHQRPIYFAHDYPQDDYDRINDYLDGAASVIGRNRVGLYGGFDVIEWAHHHALAPWLWQTHAWSGGRTSAHAHLYQYSNGHTINGAAVDFTRALKNDYGQRGIDTIEKENDMPLTDGDVKDIAAEVVKELKPIIEAVAGQVWDEKAKSPLATGQEHRNGGYLLSARKDAHLAALGVLALLDGTDAKQAAKTISEYLGAGAPAQDAVNAAKA